MFLVGDSVEVLHGVGSAYDGDVATVLETPDGRSPLWLYLRFADGSEAVFASYEVRKARNA